MPRSRALAPLIALAAPLYGCNDPVPAWKGIRVRQPIAFEHKAHLAYFASGAHRKDRIQMHLDLLGEDEPPDEIKRGDCNACHDDLASRKACSGCHVLFQDETLRARTDVRACIGCHRGVWTGHEATIPSANVCRTCHRGKPFTQSPEEKRLRNYLERGEDIPWVRTVTIDRHVDFNHKAHVRYGHIACGTCHKEMGSLAAPPDLAPVYSMNSCMGCHKKHAASNDCLACHK